MHKTAISAADGPRATGGYTQACLVNGATRMLYVSGQIPEAPDGRVPSGIENQARLVWSNIEAELVASGMCLDNLVKVTTFLSGREFRASNAKVRQEVLGDRQVALTVIITGIYDPAWLLEIEAIACD